MTEERKADMHAIRYAANNDKDINLIHNNGKALIDANTAKTMLQVYTGLKTIKAIMNFEYLLEHKPQILAGFCWKIINRLQKTHQKEHLST